MKELLCSHCGTANTTLRRLCKACRQPLPLIGRSRPSAAAAEPAVYDEGAAPREDLVAPPAPPLDSPLDSQSPSLSPSLRSSPEPCALPPRLARRTLALVAGGLALLGLLGALVVGALPRRSITLRPPGVPRVEPPRPMSTLRPLQGITAQADSEATSCPLGQGTPPRCHAALILDGDTKTAWCEGVDGPGTGQRLRLRLPQEVTVRRVDVVSGGMRPGVLGWQDVGQVEELELAAAQQHQNVRLNLEHRPPRERIVLEPGWRTRELTLTLREPRPGRVYDTLICISEVVVWID